MQKMAPGAPMWNVLFSQRVWSSGWVGGSSIERRVSSIGWAGGRYSASRIPLSFSASSISCGR